MTAEKRLLKACVARSVEEWGTEHPAAIIAREAIALLREVEERMICTEDYDDHSKCGDCKVIRSLRRFLDEDEIDPVTDLGILP